MSTQTFPNLDPQSITGTSHALHAYSQILGNCLKVCRLKRRHWWHASLRPSLMGLTTGVVHADIDFELELNFRESLLQGSASSGKVLTFELNGQPAVEMESRILDFLNAEGLPDQLLPKAIEHGTDAFVGYSAAQAKNMAHALNSVSAAMESFRASIKEETSPIQLWPHHFDLSMLWLPGDKTPGQDIENEEYSDKQMNFGFTFSDDGIPEPYFYVTAYPLPDALSKITLPKGTVWQSNGFSGAVLTWRSLLNNSDPTAYLLDLWSTLLSAGREHMSENLS